MLNVGLLDNRSAPTLNNGPLDDIYNMGNAFTVDTDCWLRSIRWYRVATGSANDVSQAHVYDASGSTTIFTVPTISDDGAVGWQEQFANVDVPLLAGHEYRVAVCMASSHRLAYWDSGTPSTPPAPFAFPSVYRRYHQGACTFPGTDGGTTYQEAVEVRVRDTPPTGAGGGLTTTDVDNRLAAWLISTGDNTHQSDGLPWLTKEVVDAIASALDDVPKAGDGDWTKIGEIWRLAGDLADAEIALWRTFVHAGGTQANLASGGGASWFTGPTGTPVGTIVGAIAKSLPHPPTAVGGSGWTLTAETDWDAEIAYAQPADAYVVAVTAVPDGQAQVDVAGVTWLPRVGWWAPLHGSTGQDRHFLEFEHQELIVPGVRMPGVLLACRAGVSGHIQAWTWSA